jgi:hypothetical protein
VRGEGMAGATWTRCEGGREEGDEVASVQV